MDSIKVIVPMNVKAKLTEKLKASLIKESEDIIKQIDLELQQIDFDEKKAAAQIPPEDLQQMQAMRAHFGQAREERMIAKAQTQERLETAKKLVIGAEIVHQQKLNRIVELNVGDNLNDLNDMEVLIEDGKIIAFRG